ncbi:hypothetical protein T492DRAFT_1138761 [Pavlovales sp. CCMP2436]|nr:hypothetical protein T492DRAFT_1138761 [Pavlovales sp. CCMP2436]
MALHFPIDVAEAATCGLLFVFNTRGPRGPAPATGRGVGGIPYFKEPEGLAALPPATGRGVGGIPYFEELEDEDPTASTSLACQPPAARWSHYSLVGSSAARRCSRWSLSPLPHAAYGRAALLTLLAFVADPPSPTQPTAATGRRQSTALWSSFVSWLHSRPTSRLLLADRAERCSRLSLTPHPQRSLRPRREGFDIAGRAAPATGRGVGGIPYFEELEGLAAPAPATGRGVGGIPYFEELESLAAPAPATGRGVGGVPYFEELEGLAAPPPATGRGVGGILYFEKLESLAAPAPVTGRGS